MLPHRGRLARGVPISGEIGYLVGAERFFIVLIRRLWGSLVCFDVSVLLGSSGPLGELTLPS